MTSAGFGLGVTAFAIGVFAFSLALSVPMTVFWIFTIIEVAKLPEPQFQAVGTTRTTWLVVVALCGSLGALIWWITKRREVMAAGPWTAFPPPGWYPDPTRPGVGGAQRWWDGLRWSEHASDPGVGSGPPTASFN
jgi:hypothetical protein